MSVINVNPNDVADLFATETSTEGIMKGGVRFGASDPNQADLFNTSVTDTTTQAVSTTDTTTQAASVTDTTTQAPASDDENKADLLGTSGDTRPKDTKKPELKDLSGYFEDRLKSGKFVAIEEDAEDGTKKRFIPRTFEEFDEVIDIQVDYKLNQRKKELEQTWYQSKSPAWQAVAKYAELTDDPSEVIPFLSGIKNIDSVKDLNPEDLDAAERIVRARFNQKGENDEAIDEQVEALKTTGKLVSAAQKYKPLILKEEKQYLSQMLKQKEEENQEYLNLVENIRGKAIEAIEKPLFGKEKLKQDEKMAIYELIAEPSEESKGYQIYTVIDSLFEKGDFDTLRMVALFLSKKESFLNYISNGAANATAAGLQKKLRVATDNRSTGSDNSNSNDTESAVVNRTRYNATPKFGR